MASYIPWKYYRLDEDVYRFPNGREVMGEEYRKFKKKEREIIDAVEAARAYDPYNHKGRLA